jgi:hypothetical protein
MGTITTLRRAKIIVPEFPDMIERGKGKNTRLVPQATMTNSLLALDALKVNCTYDAFHDRRFVAGMVLGSQVGQITDDVLLLIRKLCRIHFEFDPGKEAIWDAVNLRCREHSFNPVVEYLDKCEAKWRALDEELGDAVRRVDTWFTDYLRIEDDKAGLARAMGKLILVASVRRARRPGCKFDYMPVLIGDQDLGKSIALELLYGADNFTDQQIIGVSDKMIGENLIGRWGAESSELAGNRKGDTDHLKAQTSRTTDRFRPAYGRAVIDWGRTCALWGTTNDPIFLKSLHGNRRMPPLVVRAKIELDRIVAERDLLWGEASAMEKEYGPLLVLPPEVQKAVAAAQEAHIEEDPWSHRLADADLIPWAMRAAGATVEANMSAHAADPLAHQEPIPYECRLNDKPPVERISSMWIMETVLKIPEERQSPALFHRLTTVMVRTLKWHGPRQLWVGGRNQNGYERELIPRDT